MEVITKSSRHSRGLRRRSRAFFVIGTAMLSLSGCVGGGMDFLSDAKVDRSVATGTVPQTPPSTDTLSDEMTVRNAVTSADVQRLEGQ
ncbi:RT0821/Lpp0805 family surface protein, partial [Rhizobium ruizarguesonis]